MRQDTDPYLNAGIKGWIFNTAKKHYHRIAGFAVDDLVQEGYLCYYKCRARYVGPAATGYAYKGPLYDGGVSVRYLPENPDAPDNPADKHARRHFMRLFKTTFSNRIHDLATKCPASREVPIADYMVEAVEPEDEAAVIDRLMPAQPEEMTTMMLLKSAPREIRQLFDLLINDALDFGRYSVEQVKTERGVRKRLRPAVADDSDHSSFGLRHVVTEHGTERKRLRPTRTTRETDNRYFCRMLGLPEQDLISAVERHFLG